MYDDYDTFDGYSYEDEEAYDWLNIPEEEVDFGENECYFCGGWRHTCECEKEELQ